MGDFNSIAQMFQPLAHKRRNFYQFLWVIPLNWRTIGSDWTHALLPHPITPPTLSFPLVSLYLLNLSHSWSWATSQTFPAQSSPNPQPFDMVSTSTSVTDWTMRHMTSVQTGDKNKIRHVIQCEEVSGNDCPSPNRHTHIPTIHTPTNTNCKHMTNALQHGGMASPLLAVYTEFQPSHYQAPIKTEIWRKAKACRCSAVAQIESDSLTHNMAPVMWLGQRGTLFLNSHIPKSEPHVQLRQTHSGSCL